MTGSSMLGFLLVGAPHKLPTYIDGPDTYIHIYIYLRY